MLLEIEGVSVRVPARYPTYPQRYKDLIDRVVKEHRVRYEGRLLSLRVIRMVKGRTGVRMHFEETIGVV